MNTVFYSWQSDRSSKEGRNLIEQALKTAVERIANDTTVENAVREGLEVDRDMKGVPGSPPIFNTILDKIDKAAIFVPDLTFTGCRTKGGLTPNPNVLIEYGWALKSLGHPRIIPVMNEAHGAPTQESMPFDMAHLRFPIRYNLPDGAPDADRRAQRESLADELETALRAVFESVEFKAVSLKTQKLQDDYPQLGMKVVNLSDGPQRGAIGAAALEVECRFRHLNGRPVTSLSVEPISSIGGNFTLYIGSLSYLAAGEEQKVDFEVWKHGQRPYSKLINAIGWGKMLADFLWDSRVEGDTVAFLVIVRFRDRDEYREQRFRLIFNHTTYRFDVVDDISLPQSDNFIGDAGSPKSRF
jgi:hypothetical protein